MAFEQILGNDATNSFRRHVAIESAVAIAIANLYQDLAIAHSNTARFVKRKSLRMLVQLFLKRLIDSFAARGDSAGSQSYMHGFHGFHPFAVASSAACAVRLKSRRILRNLGDVNRPKVSPLMVITGASEQHPRQATESRLKTPSSVVSS